ncbi:IclR family transcriptional regulator [Phaeobacter gallaeciensis]|uniref:IclR family transcriptional regulator n=2 Tax=Roseobacteraceae TaxID=2854170 RepID=A0A366X6H3_9RHOB|nr:MULTISPECIES: IclR family transcriptional regulator [Roseobacteraceae]MBT3143288.1 IclR family transcriptional regulator [Falsiruegeria litorea]MBT8167552.1 IclR family transcriptional regulator [Falsiruegeria litorea]RBW57937.1 IclR family transcriptional regulator [Phaeobacter gallaeciensis]
MTDDNKGHIPTNLRLLLLVEQIAQEGAPVSPSALSAALGLPKPTVHRILATAEEEGFLQRDLDGRSFGPGSRLRKLSANALSSQRVRTERLLVLKKLAEEIGETCNLAAPGRYGMVYLDRVETHWPLRIQLPVGTRVPFHCTASGKMYLSSMPPDKLQRLLQSMQLEQKTSRSIVKPEQLMTELAETRERGFATDNQEFMEGMAAVAVPICDDHGRLLTTLSIHAPILRHDLDDLTLSIDTVRAGAKRLEEIVQ